ncbi:MAG: putative toxin-antitoxin system toxin component, PIN family [Deltaproteobacteria bacterium RBG_16_48_10]|nr:MAG: putative toxin-antitoxin system toxin component, PIN family [Deltaproteobacteria bacterium RBG_16_48_10]
MRVVFDTNIFISALVIPGSLAEKAVSRIIEGRDELVISPDIIREVLSVLSSKFGREREALSHVAVILFELGELVRPDQRVRVFRDEPDNKILECAVFGKADFIVTGNKEMLRLKEYMGVKIASLRDYLES